QHRQRLEWLESLTARRRVAIALEHLDARDQDALDRARSSDAAAAAGGDALPVRARRLAQAARFDFGAWDWRFYGPVIELALRRGLPLVAANLSRSESVAIVRSGGATVPEPPGWGDAERRALEQAIRDGHCGLLSVSALAPMA